MVMMQHVAIGARVCQGQEKGINRGGSLANQVESSENVVFLIHQSR